jgi:signal transduction histidine kinase
MDRVNDMPQIRSSLEIMNNNTDRLLHLSSQLLDFRKVEMNGFRNNFTREDIVQILEDHFVSFKEAAQLKKLTVTTHFPKVFFAYIDAEAFNKIISNLWDNAIKYAGTKASVSLQVGGDNKHTYTIEFRNDGYILPQDMNEIIFKCFYRAKETAKLPGTGIGLTLSRSLAELHGGSLLLANSTGKINTFKLCLPINPKQAL